MGRRKIEIQPLTNDRNRSVTFQKQKNGLFKKAFELGVLCSVDVAVVIFSSNSKLFEFCSGNIDEMVLRRLNYEGERDLKTPADFGEGGIGLKNGVSANGDQLESEDDDDLSDTAPTSAKRKAAGTKSRPARTSNAGDHPPQQAAHRSNSDMKPSGHNDSDTRGHSNNSKKTHDRSPHDTDGGASSRHPVSRKGTSALDRTLQLTEAQLAEYRAAEATLRQNLAATWRPPSADSQSKDSPRIDSLPSLSQLAYHRQLSNNLASSEAVRHQAAQDFLSMLAGSGGQNSTSAASSSLGFHHGAGHHGHLGGLGGHRPTMPLPFSNSPPPHHSSGHGTQRHHSLAQPPEDQSGSWLDFLSTPASSSQSSSRIALNGNSLLGGDHSSGSGFDTFPFGYGLGSGGGSGGGDRGRGSGGGPSLPHLGNLELSNFGFSMPDTMELDREREIYGKEPSEPGSRKRPRYD